MSRENGKNKGAAAGLDSENAEREGRMPAPVSEFVRAYAAAAPVRFHMPGHKGEPVLGCERLDITEIPGADSLYEAAGILKESEAHASRLFGSARTLYSAEGSSLAIRAMLYLACLAYRAKGGRGRPLIAAGRNAHRAFLTAAALLDFDVLWLFPGREDEPFSLCRCSVDKEDLARALDDPAASERLAAVYVTSPDYLGHIADLSALAQTAHERGLPLLVDNAHGAYLRFLPRSLHPLDCGADLCCDSAHKTLPVLTGGAYLHVAERADPLFSAAAREAMALFGSTSPSYLILQSLDRANAALSDAYPGALAGTAWRAAELKARLEEKGWRFAGDEPLKITVKTKESGYTGREFAEILAANSIVAEFADPDYCVLMMSPANSDRDFARLESVWERIAPKKKIAARPPRPVRPRVLLSVREAVFSVWERVSLEDAVGRVAAQPPAACPPAIAPVVPGEAVEEGAVDIFRYYDIEELDVVRGLSL